MCSRLSTVLSVPVVLKERRAMKLTKLALGVLTLGLVGVMGFQQLGRPIAVSAATNIKQVVTNTLVIPIRDPFYPDYQHRVFLFPTAFAGWWFGDDYAKGFQKVTITSLDGSLSEKVRVFYSYGLYSVSNGLEMPIMNGHVPDSTYNHYVGTMTASDDYFLFFPATPSGELTSPIRVQAPEQFVDRVVYVPARWWEPMQ